jgi:hypothetical protein
MATDPEDMLAEANEMVNDERRARCGNDGEECGLPGCPNCDETITPTCPECTAPVIDGKCSANCQRSAET